MNEYENIQESLDKIDRIRRTTNIVVVCLSLTCFILGGLIGFNIGYYFPSQQHKTVTTHQVVVDHKTVTDYKLVNVPYKQPTITCKVIDYRAGETKPYTMLQCSDGSIKVIYT